MQIEARPLTSAKARVSATNVSLSAMGQVQSLVNKLASSAKDLQNPQMLGGKSAASSDQSVVTATVSSATLASPGTFAVTNTQLAKHHMLAFPGFADPTIALPAGTLTVSSISQDFGSISDQTFSLDGVKTLQTLRDEINASALAGLVTASVINTLDGTNHYVLALAGSKSGSTATFSANLSGTQPSAFSGAGALSQQAANASAIVNGITVQSKTNTFSEAIPGVSFDTLKSSSSATVTVSDNRATLKERIRTFATDLSALNKKLVELTKPKSETEKAGPLAGNSAFLSLAIALRSKYFEGFTISQGSGSGRTYRWSDLGLELQRDGSVSIRESDLGKAIDGSTQPASVVVRIGEEMLSGFTSSVRSFLANTSLQGSIDVLQTNRTKLSTSVSDIENRLERTRKNLIAKYAALDSKLASMSQLGVNVRSSLAGLNPR
jgi:flagellar hook-associated protein 2